MPKTMKKKLTKLSNAESPSPSRTPSPLTTTVKTRKRKTKITRSKKIKKKTPIKSSSATTTTTTTGGGGNKVLRKRNYGKESPKSVISESLESEYNLLDTDVKLLIDDTTNTFENFTINIIKEQNDVNDDDEEKITILEQDKHDDDHNNNGNIEFYKIINDNYNNNNNNINDFIAIKTNLSRSNSNTSNQIENCNLHDIGVVDGAVDGDGDIGDHCSDTNGSISSLRSDNSKYTTSSSIANNNNNEDSQKSHSNSGRKRIFAHRIRRNERKKYICTICHKNFQGLNDLRKHTRIHSDERPYPCPNCEKKFRQAGCLKNHIASQHGTDVLFICHYCNKSFPIKERLRLHLRIHTGEKPYKCSICPKQFARGGQLTQHLLTHNGIKKYRCEYCPAAFSCLSNLKLHMKGHRDERDYTCHMCGKGFLRPDALKKHLLCFHGNIKAFHCKICNKMFKGHLPQHMRTHKKVKPHGCAECGAAFSQRSQLIVHQRMHSGERPYRCQVCWQAFAHSSVLKLHIRKHTGEKPFKCPLCVVSESAFSQLPHLKKHMKAIHDQEKSYMCEVCNEFFKTKIEHQQHVSMCLKFANDPDSLPDFVDIKVPVSIGVEPAMALSRMRLLVAVLLKRISTEDRLKQLGFEKRLIDNVLIGSLKLAGRNVCEDETIHESERLKINVQELLEWTVPDQYMDKFKKEQRSTEELLEELTS